LILLNILYLFDFIGIFVVFSCLKKRHGFSSTLVTGRGLGQIVNRTASGGGHRVGGFCHW